MRARARVARALVHVHVFDINDNRPLFVRLPYYTVVSLDANRGDIVRQVRVSCDCNVIAKVGDNKR